VINRSSVTVIQLFYSMLSLEV